ncbi:MAG: type II toxin-antitoxin system Phd/YefM family antitoxin [Actinobacteria bacterium]|nr:MAG: type II toxin-antitoxin system Phd/YefM family antitoxin [Actinomycetota bacterium]TDB38508.1 MAG: type II toxin-antitoxin system Phd/YefM family antitoxin [Actinomycetota bacterium]
MASLRPSIDVRPVTEFRANTSAVIDQMHSTKRPVVLTQHGRSAAVLLDVAVYEGLLDEIELLRDLRVAEDQIVAGKVISHAEVVRRMREKYSL